MLCRHVSSCHLLLSTSNVNVYPCLLHTPYDRGGSVVFALVFVPQQNDKFYDLGGAVGWLSSTAISLYYPSVKAKFWDGTPGALPRLTSFAPRQVLLSAAVGLWSLRLGTFLATVGYTLGDAVIT